MFTPIFKPPHFNTFFLLIIDTLFGLPNVIHPASGKRSLSSFPRRWVRRCFAEILFAADERLHLFVGSKIDFFVSRSNEPSRWLGQWQRDLLGDVWKLEMVVCLRILTQSYTRFQQSRLIHRRSLYQTWPHRSYLKPLAVATPIKAMPWTSSHKVDLRSESRWLASPKRWRFVAIINQD